MTMIQTLSNDTLRRVAPSIFATTPYHRMSDRYKFIPTIEVVDMLRNQGFHPVRAQQSTSRTEGKAEFTRHLVRFRHNDYLVPTVVGSEFPELVMTNSHDGTACYQFEAGLYRLVCSNGMVVSSGQFDRVSVRHLGGSDFHDRVIDATYQVMSIAPTIAKQVDGWKQLQLSPPQRQAFAEAALELRDTKTFAPSQLLRTRRMADQSADVWTTANVIQENMLQGGMRGRSDTGRRTVTRPVKGVAEDLRLNRALWTLAERMASLIG